MTTAVGRFLRKLRIDNNEILADMASALSVSPAFLSAVENGKKRVPAGWSIKICDLYHLNKQQALELDKAIAETEQSCEMNLSDVAQQNREIAVSFARKFKELDEEQIAAIRKLLGVD
ncbi:MAG: helix-turn-helix domain-containing protein [Firmicutes bacterium]|nr:helix-turn-helix domain-containing protein [Bacillota bacterium]